MNSARMLVATHKAAEIPDDDFYLPVHVGYALNPVDLGFQPDNEGKNISHLNASYCELTAIFWAWKNLTADAVGLSHYRRYFKGNQPGPNGSKVLSAAEASSLLSDYDIILSKPRNYLIETIDSHYRNGHHGGDLDVLRTVLAEQSPKSLAAYDRVFTGNKLSLYNMFFMRWDLFDAYSAWLFPILTSVGALIDNSSRSAYQQRTFGYLAERLLNVWAADHPELKVAYKGVINTEGEPKVRKAAGLIKRKLMTRSL